MHENIVPFIQDGKKVLSSATFQTKLKEILQRNNLNWQVERCSSFPQWHRSQKDASMQGKKKKYVTEQAVLMLYFYFIGNGCFMQ